MATLGDISKMTSIQKKKVGFYKIPKEFRLTPINEPKRSVNTSQK
jgi:hypothetical protein